MCNPGTTCNVESADVLVRLDKPQEMKCAGQNGGCRLSGDEDPVSVN